MAHEDDEVAQPIPFTELSARSLDAVSDFCERVHRHGYALLRFPPDAQQEVTSLRALATIFFALPPEQKLSIGDFRFIGDT